ncbi:MAG: histidine--tRNA ligase [bacterium]
MDRISAPRGTQDILPPDSNLWTQLEETIRRNGERFVYGEIRTPIFEHSELFARGVGQDTDIVSKEMYTLLDRGGRSLTLRPEGTACVARAFLQQNLANLRGLPQKLFYIGPMFRYERPQAGRYRQHHQFGFEVFGDPQPEMDAEVIAIAISIFRALGIRQFEVDLNSIGCRECRPVFLAALKKELAPHLMELCTDCQRRYQQNPIRMLDCKKETCQLMLDQAPHPVDFLCLQCQTHFIRMQKCLSALGFSFRLSPRLVRGLDYYTRTVFEIVSPELGAQNALCGGGRYDDLIEILGGPPTPGVGFAGGMERAMLILQENQAPEPLRLDVYLVPLGEEAYSQAMLLAMRLREAGIRTELSYDRRGLSAQLKVANRKHARFALLLGEQELKEGSLLLRNMESGEQRTISKSEVLQSISSVLAV